MSKDSEPLEDPPVRTIFQCDAWVQACAAATAGRLRMGPEVCAEDTDPLRLLERRVGPFLVAGAPLPKSGTPMSAGLGGSAAANSATLARLGEWFPYSRLSLLQVTCPTPPGDCGASRIETLANLELDLRPECAALWTGLSSLPKRMIRKSLRAGIRIASFEPTSDHLDRHRGIVDELFRAQAERPILLPPHYLAIQRSPLREHVRGFVASRDGQPLGYLITLVDHDRAYYWDVAVRPEARADGAGHLLFWAWMRWCKRRGIQRLDLIGPPEGGRAGRRSGIGRFKLSFGAQPVNYSVVYWYRALAGKALDASRWLARFKSSDEPENLSTRAGRE